MEFERLRYLLTVNEEGNISKAADKLYMSQPSLSKIISSIEGMLGFKVFERTPGGLVPTRLGARYLRFAQDVVAMEEKLTDDLERIRAEQKKHLIVFGFSHTRTAYVIPKELSLNRFPDVQIMTRSLRDGELLEGLQDGTIDFALLTAPFSGQFPAGIRHRELYSERILIGVPTANPISQEGEERLGEDYPYLAPRFLNNQDIIMSGEGTGLFELEKAFFIAEEITPNVRMFEDSVRFAKRFAEECMGICFVTEDVARHETGDAIRFFTTNSTLPIRHVCIAWNKMLEKDPVRYAVLQSRIDALSRT